MMYGIMGREKGKGKFAPLDYNGGTFVTNVIYQTLWDDKEHVNKLIDHLNTENTDYEFKIIKRG